MTGGPAARGGGSFEGSSPLRKISQTTFGSREAVRPTRNRKRGEPHGRLRGATNPRAVQGSGPRIRLLRRKPLKPGGTARAERVRDVAVPSRSLDDGPGGSGRRDGVGEGAIDEPHERSPTAGRGLRAAPHGLDRTNRDVSEVEAFLGLDPMRSAHGVVVMANDPPRTGCRGRRATASAAAVKSPSSPDSLTTERRGVPQGTAHQFVARHSAGESPDRKSVV